VINSPLSNTGSVQANDRGLIVFEGTASGGTANIVGGGQIEFGAATSMGVKFAFESNGVLTLDDAPQYKGTISGFAHAQLIDLTDIAFANATESFGNGVLTVDDHAGDVAHIKFAGTFTIANFAFSDDGHGGTLINDPPAAKSAPSSGNPLTVLGLLGQYIASSFPMLLGGAASNAWTDVFHAVTPQPLLAHPHA
jgi:hypothetical protein